MPNANRAFLSVCRVPSVFRSPYVHQRPRERLQRAFRDAGNLTI